MAMVGACLCEDLNHACNLWIYEIEMGMGKPPTYTWHIKYRGGGRLKGEKHRGCLKQAMRAMFSLAGLLLADGGGGWCLRLLLVDCLMGPMPIPFNCLILPKCIICSLFLPPPVDHYIYPHHTIIHSYPKLPFKIVSLSAYWYAPSFQPPLVAVFSLAFSLIGKWVMKCVCCAFVMKVWYYPYTVCYRTNIA